MMFSATFPREMQAGQLQEKSCQKFVRIKPQFVLLRGGGGYILSGFFRIVEGLLTTLYQFSFEAGILNSLCQCSLGTSSSDSGALHETTARTIPESFA